MTAALGALDVVVDGGLDDALALAVLHGAGADLRQIVATEGSVGLRDTAATTARWAAVLGIAAPVVLGTDRGRREPYPAGRDPFHGTDAFGGRADGLPAAAEPTVGWRDLQGHVVCTGALTVVADAIRRGDPVRDVVWMGGAVAAGGNMTAAAEFNAWMDPTAADEVLTSGVPVRMVPLDVTHRFRWDDRRVADLRRRPGAVGLLAGALASIVARDGWCIPHDAVAAVAALEPDLFAWSSHPVRCERHGDHTRGVTVVDRRRAPGVGPVQVADDVDVARVTDRILRSLDRAG